MLDFKGLFHDNDIKHNYYEGGAHFKYSDLVKKLNKLIKYLSPNRISQNYTLSTSTLDENKKIKNKLRKKQKKNKKCDLLEPNILSDKNLIEIKDEIKKAKKFSCQLPNIEIKNKIYKKRNKNCSTIKITKHNSDYNNCSPPVIINKSSDPSINKNLLPKINFSNVISESNLELDSLTKKNLKKHIKRKKAHFSLQNSNDKRNKFKDLEISPETSEKIIEEYNRKAILEKKILIENKEHRLNTSIKDKKRKKFYENDLKFLQRIDEIKRQLLGLSNKSKKIKLVRTIKMQSYDLD